MHPHLMISNTKAQARSVDCAAVSEEIASLPARRLAWLALRCAFFGNVPGGAGRQNKNSSMRRSTLERSAKLVPVSGSECRKISP